MYKKATCENRVMINRPSGDRPLFHGMRLIYVDKTAGGSVEKCGGNGI